MVPPPSYPPILAGRRGLVCIMPLTPSLVQVSIEFNRPIEFNRADGSTRWGGSCVFCPLTCTRTTHYSVFAQSVSTIELSRVIELQYSRIQDSRFKIPGQLCPGILNLGSWIREY